MESQDPIILNPIDRKAKQAYLARKQEERTRGALARTILVSGVVSGVVGIGMFVWYYLRYADDPETAWMGWVFLGVVLTGLGGFGAIFGVRLLVAVQPVVNRYSGWRWRTQPPR